MQRGGLSLRGTSFMSVQDYEALVHAATQLATGQPLGTVVHPRLWQQLYAAGQLFGHISEAQREELGILHGFLPRAPGQVVPFHLPGMHNAHERPATNRPPCEWVLENQIRV